MMLSSMTRTIPRWKQCRRRFHNLPVCESNNAVGQGRREIGEEIMMDQKMNR